MSIAVGQTVWYEGDGGYLLPGKVVRADTHRKTLVVQDVGSSEVCSVPVKSVRPRDEGGTTGLEDMIQLSDLHEGALIYNIKKRFTRSLIYTYTGSILVAVNPYQVFDVYGVEVVHQYEGQLIGKLPPHIFAIASSAYSHMRASQGDQCLVVSGESGAGKTETTKLVLQYMAAVNKSSSNLISEQILEATPLLEAFGNAKTVRNNNSSRFGKYLEVYFDKSGIISGAKTSEYLLEKSRIVNQARGERNYHVFYEMLWGLPPEELETYGLTCPDDYFYLNQGGACELPGKDDARDFKRLTSAMELLGIQGEEKEAIFRILAAVLHLGNMYFGSADQNGQEAAVVESPTQLQSIANLLSGPVEKYKVSLTNKITVMRGEMFYSPLNVGQALDTRDALAKALYSYLFTWLVSRINGITCRQEKHSSIAVLDIFGFEDFEVNSLEQLCINFANEQLQFYFNQHIFQLEQEEYAREGIRWEAVEFRDNQPCLDLICRRPLGVLHLLDDESNFPKATDISFLEKSHKEHSGNPHYVQPKQRVARFGIRHYAGLVWYQVNMFLDKNRDMLRPDLLDLLQGSKSKFISTLFSSDEPGGPSSSQRTRTPTTTPTRKRAPTVASKFSLSLSHLITAMSKCHPYFVRCIKPNPEKLPSLFEDKLVMEQLRYSGMMETVRIRRAGYPIRVKFISFVDRYGCLCPCVCGHRPHTDEEAKEMSVKILQSLSRVVSAKHYQIGITKIFLRETAERSLEEARALKLKATVVLIQKRVRGFLARSRYQRVYKAALCIQRFVKGHQARCNYQRLRRGVIKLQALFRMWRQRMIFLTMLEAERAAEEEALRRIEEEQKQQRLAAITQASRKSREHVVSVAGEEEEQQSHGTNVTHSITTSPSRSGPTHPTACRVQQLDVPAELAVVLQALTKWQNANITKGLTGTKGEVVEYSQNTRELPKKINTFSFCKFAGTYFQEGFVYAMAKVPLPSSLLKLKSKSAEGEAVALFKLVMRFMADHNLGGVKQMVLGNYIIQKALTVRGLGEELYAQLCNQMWCNRDEEGLRRGWILMALSTGTIPPSSRMENYLINYVSSYGYDGYKAYCQHKLLRTDPQHAARSLPPCLLEWRSAKSFATMALKFRYPEGEAVYASIDSWTTATEIATILTQKSGITVGVKGWSLTLEDGSERLDLVGYGYLLDAVSSIEVPYHFPTAGPYPHLPSWVGGVKRVSSVPSLSAFVQHPADPSPQSMSGYLDSLFRPVLEGGSDEEDEGVITDIDTLSSSTKTTDPPPPPPPPLIKSPGQHATTSRNQFLSSRTDNSNNNNSVPVPNPPTCGGSSQIPIPPPPPPPPPLRSGASSQSPNPPPPGSSSQIPIPPPPPLPTEQKPATKPPKLVGIRGTAFDSGGSFDQSVIPPPLAFQAETPPKLQKLKSLPKQPSLEDFHAELMRKVSKSDLSKQMSKGKVKQTDSPLTVSSSGSHPPSESHISPQSSTELVKKLSSQIEQKLAESAPIRAQLFKKSSQEKTGSESATRTRNPSKGSRRSGSSEMKSRRLRRDTSGSIERQDSIATMHKRRNRLSSFRVPHYGQVLTADPVADAPPPLPGKICKFDPLTTPPVTYSSPSWTITLRKEFFAPWENLENTTALNMVYGQIVGDLSKDSCVRLTDEDRDSLIQLFERHKIGTEWRKASMAVKQEVIERAKQLPCYFAQIYEVKSRDPAPQCTHLGVGHSGVTLIHQAKTGAALVPVDKLSYDNIMDCAGKRDSIILRLVVGKREKKLAYKTKYASNITDLMCSQLAALQKNVRHVLALADYLTQESSLLSFPAGAVVTLGEREGLDKGWLYGEFEGNSGSFPEEYTAPIVCVGEKPTEAAILKTQLLASSRPPSRAFRKESQPALPPELSPTSSTDAVGRDSGAPRTLSQLYTMPAGADLSVLRFATEHFLQGQERVDMIKRLDGSFKGLRLIGSLRDTIRGVRRKASLPTDITELTKFSKSPIPVPLLQLDSSDTALNKLAVECFLAIMRFMGDYMCKGKTEEDHVLFLLRSARENDALRDEIYCQLMKQTTSNRSTRTEGCLRGWQLLVVCTAYFPCSSLLLPYLLHYLQSHCSDPKASDIHVPAAISESNLRKTFQFGGRRDPPTTAEIQTIMAGRYTKRQAFYLPGDTSKVLRIKNSTTAHDILHELCGMLGLQGDDDLEEFGLHADLGKQTLPLPLLPSDYIQDIVSMLETQELQYTLCFSKLLWYRPLNTDNALYVDVLYQQAKYDVLKANLLPLENGELSKKTTDTICQLAALQYKAENERESAPTMKQTARLIPPSLSRHMRPQQWVERVHYFYQKTAVKLSQSDARHKYFDVASRLPMYGSRFFPIMSCSDSRAPGESLMAINKRGVFFLDNSSKEEFMRFSFDEIVSTRKLRSQAGRQYLDIKCGNLMQQTVIRCETPYGREIVPVMSGYVKLRAGDHRREDEARGVVRGASFY